MKRIVAGIVGTGAIAAGVLAGAGTASAVPKYEWAQMGPYSSSWTCDQARSSYPANTGASCYGTPKGGYYFSFQRQASR